MIVDRYDPINLFELAPKLNLEFEPELAHLDELLDDDELLFNLVKADLLKRCPNSGTLGRHSTPVEVILRILVVKRLYNMSYEQTERFVNDSIVSRQFTRLYYLERGLPTTHHLDPLGERDRLRDGPCPNDRGVELAHSLKATRGGRK